MIDNERLICIHKLMQTLMRLGFLKDGSDRFCFAVDICHYWDKRGQTLSD
jgi:hypothetical protein